VLWVPCGTKFFAVSNFTGFSAIRKKSFRVKTFPQKLSPQTFTPLLIAFYIQYKIILVASYLNLVFRSETKRN